MLCALDNFHDISRQIVIAGAPESKETLEFVQALHALYLPNTLLILAYGSSGQHFLQRKMPILADLSPIKGKATAYVCENFSCKLPTTDKDEMLALLGN